MPACSSLELGAKFGMSVTDGFSRGSARGRVTPHLHDLGVLADTNGQEEILKLLREQKQVTQSLVQQNTSLMLLHAKLNKELKELKDETFNLQEFAQDLKLEISNQAVRPSNHKKRNARLSTGLTVRNVLLVLKILIMYVFLILEEG